jgi:hypothetical protein
MPGRYAGKVVRRHEFFEEVDQFGFLERMYWEMHHRKPVTERRVAWRASAARLKALSSCSAAAEDEIKAA